MTKVTAIITLIIVLILSAVTASAAQPEYRLGAGDILAISVWGYDELQAKDLIVRPDGKIAFPLAGELQVDGLTPAELTKQLTATLAEYVVNPLVTINIVKYRTTRVYVLGEVTRPGMYEIDKGHTLLDAIGMAGGYTNDAAKKKVHIVRRDNPGTPAKVNLLDILQNGNISQNVSLGEGDVVYLSKNGRVDFAKDILPYLTAAYYVHDIKNN